MIDKLKGSSEGVNCEKPELMSITTDCSTSATYCEIQATPAQTFMQWPGLAIKRPLLRS